MKRLNTDREIAPIVAQFVPVKLDVSSEEYSQWRKDHPSEGNTIPKLFVVRADGETLYGRSGSLKGSDLPLMLVEALKRSGRILTAREATSLNDAADEYEKLMSENQPSQAIRLLSRLRKIGEPGLIASYAAPAVRLNTLVQETTTEIKQQLEELGEKVDSEDSTAKLDAILDFLRLKREFGAMKSLKPELLAFQKRYTTKANSQLTREAKIIDSVIAANSTSKKTRALARLETLIAESEIEAVQKLGSDLLQAETTSIE